MYNNKNIIGTTLIEILIYVGLLTTVLAVVTNFLYQVANFRLIHQQDSLLFQNSQIIMDKLEKDIEDANQIITPSDDNFNSSLVLENDAGQITYAINDGYLTKNSIKLTDNQVEVYLKDLMGFRKIGQTIQIRLGIRSKIRAFGQSRKENIYQTAFYYEEDI